MTMTGYSGEQRRWTRATTRTRAAATTGKRRRGAKTGRKILERARNPQALAPLLPSQRRAHAPNCTATRTSAALRWAVASSTSLSLSRPSALLLSAEGDGDAAADEEDGEGFSEEEVEEEGGGDDGEDYGEVRHPFPPIAPSWPAGHPHKTESPVATTRLFGDPLSLPNLPAQSGARQAEGYPLWRAPQALARRPGQRAGFRRRRAWAGV